MTWPRKLGNWEARKHASLESVRVRRKRATARWQLERSYAGDRPQLATAVGRYLPKDHAFGDLGIKIEAIESETQPKRIEFYTSVVLDGVHPCIGESGWDSDGRQATVEALNEALRQMRHVVRLLSAVKPPRPEELRRLARAYARFVRSNRKRAARKLGSSPKPARRKR